MAKVKQREDGYFRKWYKGKQFFGKTLAEATAKRDQYKYEMEHGIEQQKSITVFDYAAQWLPIAKAGVAKRTYNQYATTMERLTDVVGNKLMSAVTPFDIKKVWAGYVGLSQSYISKARFLYSSMFKSAIENGYCKINPIDSASAQPHKGETGTHRALTETEIHLIETVPHRVQPGAMFMLKAGLRRGEVLALRRKDIHDGRIYIHSAVKFDSNQPVVGKTKNESSVRSLPLFKPLLPILSAVTDYVLPSAEGKLCSESAFDRAWDSYLSELSAVHNGCQKRWWHLTKEWKQTHPKEYQHYLKLKAEKKKAEAEEYRLRGWEEISFRPHDLRHTFVTVCRDKHVDIKVVISWCGHGSEKMVLEIYDHLSKDREQDGLDALYG